MLSLDYCAETKHEKTQVLYRESVRSLLAQVKNEAANIDKVVETIDTNVYNLNAEIEDVSPSFAPAAAAAVFAAQYPQIPPVPPDQTHGQESVSILNIPVWKKSYPEYFQYAEYPALYRHPHPL